jgi:general secretion pathway protein I
MSPARNSRAGEAGFSLVEALVALFVFALAGVALVQLQAHSIRTFADVERRALAAILAQNALVEAAAAPNPPDLGLRDDEPELAGHTWKRHVAVEATPDGAMRRVTVLVREREGGEPVGQAQGFIIVHENAPPPAAPGGPS